MNPKIFWLKAVALVILISSCNKDNRGNNASPSKNADPARCTTVDVGEAADFVEQQNIADDRLVRAHGLTNPQALVWRDENTGKTFYLARIMGTERKLFYLKEVPDDSPAPGVSSLFEGRLLRWKHLPAEQARHLAAGLKTQYNIDVDLNEALLIVEGQKPDGC